MSEYDVAVIGSGPGGYVCAIRCAQLGMKTALIEKYPALGGTCLNVGCIPSKALLDSTEHYHAAETKFSEHGISIEGLKADLDQMVSRKDGVVSQTVEGINYLMKKNKVDVHYGHASIESANEISILKDDKSSHKIGAVKIVIATGSKPAVLPGIENDKKRVITSTEALNLKEIPGHMVVIGGGAIGLELGSVYARLGSKITVVEYLDSIIPMMDRSLSKELERSLKKLGFKFMYNHAVSEAKSDGKQVIVKAKDHKKDKEVELKADYCLVSVGRSPYTQGLGLQKAGVATDEKGRVEVNENLETSVKGIYAIGDVVKGPMLAHKAEEEGVFVAELLAGQKPHISYGLIPNVVYTWPEVSSVGQTETELKLAGVKFKTGSFPFRASGRARASMDVDGLIKVIADKETDEILGVHMIGPRAADLISEAVLAMEFRASAEDVARMCHPHPTYSEAFKEACLAATEDRAIHS